ncbi:guanylate-binding protein 2-like [Rhinophrynus dorsalis]
MTAEICMPLPVCLIDNKNGQELTINPEAEQILSKISQPVVVVAIVGKYRTGKSYLMNKLAGQRSGFPLGSTIQSKTKGIWIWCVPHPCKPGHTLVLLDTEGLGDVEKGDSKNDIWIFCLAVLLSSNLVFNSLGTIDQQAMEQLHYVTELTKWIRVKSSPGKEEDESAEFKRIFPSFTWCVRDFCLILQVDGKEVTEHEYLMNSLKLKKGASESIQDYNLPRECILRYFHSHKCFVFDRPASKKNLQRLEELQECELEEEFVQQTQRFCDYMFTEGRIKTVIGGHFVTGKLLWNLTALYVKEIQSGSVPCLENTVLALSLTENTRAVQDALCKYEVEMNQKASRFPTETQDEFLILHRECEKEAVKIFLGLTFNDENQKYQIQLKDHINEKMKAFSQRNEEASAERCRALIQELSVTLEKRTSQEAYIKPSCHKVLTQEDQTRLLVALSPNNGIQIKQGLQDQYRGLMLDLSVTLQKRRLEGTYFKPGGYKQFLEDKIRLMEEYNNRPGKGIKALEVLQEFINSKKSTEAAILQADQRLTEKEKKIAEEQTRAEAAKRLKNILEEDNRRLQEHMESQRLSLEQHEKMLREKMEEDRVRMVKENEWMVTQKLKEQEAFLKAGYQDKINGLQQQIAHLQVHR